MNEPAPALKLPAGFTDEDIIEMPAGHEVITRLDDDSFKSLGETAFQLDKQQDADFSRQVIQDLQAAGWTQAEFNYALALFRQTNEPDLIKEIRYARSINNTLFNMVRGRPEILPGRLHTIAGAGKISQQAKKSIKDMFVPMRVPGKEKLFYMLK